MNNSLLSLTKNLPISVNVLKDRAAFATECEGRWGVTPYVDAGVNYFGFNSGDGNLYNLWATTSGALITIFCAESDHNFLSYTSSAEDQQKVYENIPQHFLSHIQGREETFENKSIHTSGGIFFAASFALWIFDNKWCTNIFNEKLLQTGSEYNNVRSLLKPLTFGDFPTVSEYLKNLNDLNSYSEKERKNIQHLSKKYFGTKMW